MIRQRILGSCVALFSLCCLAQGAWAAEISTPVTDWVVSQVPAGGNGGDGHCSMKDTFQDSKELVFVRDGEGLTSIGIDFKKDTLEDGVSYDVTAYAGTVVRKMSALAVGKQVLIMKIGLDRAFFAALGSESSLSFRLIGREFDFGLQGMKAALQGLTDCATQLAPAKKPVSDQPVPESAPVKKKKTSARQKQPKQSQRHEEAALQHELEVDRLKAENQKLAQTIKNARADAQAEISYLKEENRKLSGHVQSSDVAKPPVQIAETGPVVNKAGPEPLKELLEAARIADGKIETKEYSAAGARSYGWVSDNIYGFAQELPWPSGKNFNDLADNYLKESSGRCKGDFSQTMGSVSQAGKAQILEAEMACLDQVNNAAAAVLFVAKQDKFYVITQEGTTEQMPDVLTKRDLVESVVRADKAG